MTEERMAAKNLVGRGEEVGRAMECLMRRLLDGFGGRKELV